MFRKMYPGAYAQNLRWAKKLGIPGWNGLESYASSVRAHDIFASNLTITYDSFSNVPHKDNDKDVFVTSGCWVNLYFNKLLRPDQEWPLIGGNFHLFEYSLMIDFSRNRGLTWLTWVGTRDYHMTSEIQNPTGAKGYDRLGSSLQVSAELEGRVQEHLRGASKENQIHDDSTRRAEENAKRTRKGKKVNK